jgi:hypothetical protein
LWNRIDTEKNEGIGNYRNSEVKTKHQNQEPKWNGEGKRKMENRNLCELKFTTVFEDIMAPWFD